MRKVVFSIVMAFVLAAECLCAVACAGKSFTVTFDGDGGSLVSGEETQIVNDASEIKEPVYEREGYEFIGWDTAVSELKKNATVKAKWKDLSFTVTFDGNGGTLFSGTEQQKVTYASEITPPVYTKDGYKFVGWDKDISELKVNTTVKAQWKMYFTIVFDGNGGTLFSGEETQTVTDASQIVPPVYKKDGCEFAGWSSSISELNSDTIVRAQWNTVGFIVIFRGNGGTLVSGTEQQKVTDVSQIIPPVYERDGYKFVGWDKDISKLKSDTIVNAQWKKYFTVTFDGNGGTLVGGEESQTVTDASQIVPPEYKMDGYDFVGWSVDLRLVKTDVTVKAQWQIIGKNYTLMFNENPKGVTVTGRGVVLDDDLKIIKVDKGASLGNRLPKGKPADAEEYKFIKWVFYIGDKETELTADFVFNEETLAGLKGTVINVYPVMRKLWIGPY